MIKRALPWIFLLCVLLGFSFQTSREKQRAAIVISSKGTVTLMSAGRVDSSVVGLDLFSGDTLTTDTSGSATLLFMDSAMVRITGGATLVVGRDSKESYRETSTGRQALSSADFLDMCSTPKILVYSRTDERSLISLERGEIDIEPSVKPVFPSGTVYDRKPVFTWIDQRARPDRKKDQEYTIILYEQERENPESDKLVFKEAGRWAVSGRTFAFNEYTLPQDLLRAKKYHWDIYVTGQEPQRAEEAGPRVDFSILSDVEAPRISNILECYRSALSDKRIDPNTYHLLCASYLKGQYLRSEASEEFEMLGGLLKRNSYPYEEVAVLTKRLGEAALSKYYDAVEKVRQLSPRRE
ncbi:MAG: hypothetical protein WBW16_04340 [Bacteroidota bacterium]